MGLISLWSCLVAAQHSSHQGRAQLPTLPTNTPNILRLGVVWRYGPGKSSCLSTLAVHTLWIPGFFQYNFDARPWKWKPSVHQATASFFQRQVKLSRNAWITALPTKAHDETLVFFLWIAACHLETECMLFACCLPGFPLLSAFSLAWKRCDRAGTQTPAMVLGWS